MGRFDDEVYTGAGAVNRQRDIVLSANEFVFIQSKTNGAIKTYTGPTTATISAQESLVTFNNLTKRFEETTDFEKARQLFTSAPEGWYVVLKNPSVDSLYPEPAKAVMSQELKIGRKVNIAGPCSFSLYPGQMTKVIRGHRLRSNQYLLARVYDAIEAEKNMASATVIDTEGKEKEVKGAKYYAGQLLVIKGTEISFYMPPTGIEVIAVGGKGDTYIRDAVTLERLEYAILKDEDGEKRYVHGPAVVFPKPTETFIETPKGGNIFRALELSPISGIYVKVIAEYTDKDKDGNDVIHPIGEELFITGNDQMIYYPRPEHAMIQYDGKYMHHAIAIPEGEGRYILNRLTGVITTVKGPKMYLPDPRTEVVVKRKLTAAECALLYPDNKEVRAYNDSLNEKVIEKMARNGDTNAIIDALNNTYSTSNQESSLAIFEANANISRGVSYTKPRTITLDTRYDGVVSVNVWTGYAINVVSKTGKREVILGPTTRLLDYDETLESITLSTGRPKTTDYLLHTAYLRVENNKVSDLINVQTKDYVDVHVKVSYCIDFLEEYKDKWFAVENYVKYLCDRMRSLLKREARLHTIEDFYANSTDIVRKVVLNLSEDKSIDNKSSKDGRLFEENGMFVHDVEVLSVGVEEGIANILNEHQKEILTKTLELSDAAKKMETSLKLAEYERQQKELSYENKQKALELDKLYETEKLKAQKALDDERNAVKLASKQAEADMQIVLDVIQKAELERAKKADNAKIETEKKLAAIEKAKQDAYAATVANIMGSVSPDLIAAMTSKSNAAMLETVTSSMAPYALAKGESVTDVTMKLLKGTSLEEFVQNLKSYKIED